MLFVDRCKLCWIVLICLNLLSFSAKAQNSSCDEVYKTYKRYLKQAEKSKSKVELQGFLMIFMTFEQGNANCFISGVGPRLLLQRQQLYAKPAKRPVVTRRPVPRPVRRPPPARKPVRAPALRPPLRPVTRRISPGKPAVKRRTKPPQLRSRTAPPASPLFPEPRKPRPVVERKAGFCWALELGGSSFNYQLLNPPITGREAIRSMNFGGFLLGLRWGYKWPRFLLTGDIMYVIGGGSLLQLGVTAGYILNRYLILEAGLAFNAASTFEEDLQQGQLTVPVEIGALVRFPLELINLGLRLTTGLAYDNANSAVSWSIRVNFILGSLF